MRDLNNLLKTETKVLVQLHQTSNMILQSCPHLFLKIVFLEDVRHKQNEMFPIKVISNVG